MLTREEMHEVQYASFVATHTQQQGSAGQQAAALGLPTDLHEPLVGSTAADESAEESALSSSSSYLAPGGARANGGRRSPSPSPSGRVRVLFVHDTQSVREELADGSVTSRTLESRQMRISPDTRTGAESPAEAAATAAALAAAAVAQANSSTIDISSDLAQLGDAEAAAADQPSSPSRATSVRIEELSDEQQEDGAQQQPLVDEPQVDEFKEPLAVDEAPLAQADEEEKEWEADAAPTRSRR
jgi:hypothetical protein